MIQVKVFTQAFQSRQSKLIFLITRSKHLYSSSSRLLVCN